MDLELKPEPELRPEMDLELKPEPELRPELKLEPELELELELELERTEKAASVRRMTGHPAPARG
jgi:hypothetical protein